MYKPQGKIRGRDSVDQVKRTGLLNGRTSPRLRVGRAMADTNILVSAWIGGAMSGVSTTNLPSIQTSDTLFAHSV